MRIDARKKVNDIIHELPSAAKILQNLGIDYFHNGNRSLWDACTNAGVPIGRAVEELKMAEESWRQYRHYSNNAI